MSNFHKMPDKIEPLQDLLDDVSNWETRRRRRFYISLAIPVALAILLLVFVAVKTSDLQKRVDQLNREIQEKTDAAAQLQNKIDSTKKIYDEVGFTFEKDFAWDKNDVIDKSESAIRESNLAHAKIMESLTANKINVETVIRYYSRRSDHDQVALTLKKCAFRDFYIFNESFDDPTPTNTIFFSKEVNIEDVKIVAYALIRAGLKIRHIEAYTKNAQKQKTGSIEIAGMPEFESGRTYSVRDIADATVF